MYIYAYPTGQLVGSEEPLAPELALDLEFIEQRECDMDFVYTHRLVDGEIVQPDPGYATNRLVRYPAITDQLDSLWHDIDQGCFGEQAKTSKFYQSILAVKQDFPKN